MLKKRHIVLLTIILLLMFSIVGKAADLRAVEYTVSGDSSDIDILQLDADFGMNNGNTAGFTLGYDGDDFHAGCLFGLNAVMRQTYRIDAHLLFTDEADGIDFGKAIGVSASTLYSGNNFFWETYYFIDEDLDNHAYYRGGMSVPMTRRSSFIIGLGNLYWDLDEDVVNLGLEVKL
ncbi:MULTISPECIES: hypothetical protein [unclassified Halanaerobium]|jgi:hypothetical protein|uniref:hypothetical protein n=1 Tax=unclassified Halanaerobium TaxID=2641197 RepID=UPI000DF13259|nr:MULTISPECIES: hypothetical protein [unclassified Halanaerobium]RCW43819.1 hypothetical protein DFR78_12318 [Halanaerobium sp. MA284_MarDTE_T2]RCW80520.1 hypothetical protein DER71_12915 [Halanaerobium sp. DL-01]